TLATLSSSQCTRRFEQLRCFVVADAVLLGELARHVNAEVAHGLASPLFGGEALGGFEHLRRVGVDPVLLRKLFGDVSAGGLQCTTASVGRAQAAEVLRDRDIHALVGRGLLEAGAQRLATRGLTCANGRRRSLWFLVVTHR